MTREEKVARRLEKLHAIEDAVITLVLYGMTWIAGMAVINKFLGLW